ncbi:helix-turn-helix transcriptional regulator [Streptomyces alboniger]|uniref:Helix-turn-helix transcriptional regulator n=1 Tax=Streptomyces alboniger TaxID=132473 RepID=A0A5J6HPJ2_STRAD|nr:LuxR family transcriptional regulator [Streptomyces alboniger]QEV20403.1 helix-turn-helix transcriptional regulator [Streptomyces alboniger]
MLAGVQTRSVSPVFVGRSDELGILNEALARATGTPLEGAGSPGTGEPQALLLGGEAGVGKTRLVEEFTEAAEKRGAVVALGGCVEIGADGLPFAPFSTALRALRRQLPDELAAAAEGQEEELARLLPELAGAAPHPGGPGGRSDEQDMARLFELTARLLERLSRERTVVVALEDLHWADASTRHLLAYLFRTLRGGRLVLLATYRADDIHRRHPLRPLLAELDRLRTVRRIELGRFSKDEVARQMAGIFAAEPEQSLVDDIFDRSDGNAFFVEELAVATHGGSCAGLTDSLRDLLLVRVEELPEDTQRVARIVAEGGSTVEYELLAEVAGLGEDDLIEALRAAVGANILLASPEGDGYRFRHSLVREAVSDDLLPGERSRINRRFAEALEADPALVTADQRAARLATYWYYAHDAAKALPAVLRASVEARHRHAYAEQLRLLERAMELWDDAPDSVRAELRPADYVEGYPACGCDPTTPLSYLDLMAEATVAGRLCGERDRALKSTKRALRLLDGENDPLRSAWFWVQRSRLVSTLGRGDGWAEIAKAQELMRGLPPSEVHADVLVYRASWGMLHDPGPETMAAAERAVEFARMVKADTIELNARLTRGNLLIEAGDPEAGLAEMYEVRDRVVEQGLVTDLGRAHINLPSALEGVGRSAESVKVAMEGIEFCRKYGLVDTEGWIWANAAEALVSLGRWDEAAEAVAHTHRCVHSSKPRGSAEQCSARMALFRGDLDAATRHLQAAHHHYGTHDPQPQYTLPLARIALGIAAAEGRILDGRAQAEDHLASGLPFGTYKYGWPLLLTAAAMEADARGLPAAEQGRPAALERIRAVTKSLATPIPLWRAYDEWTRAELLRAEGRDGPADWSAVLAAVEPLDRPYDLAQVRLRLAEALLASDGTDRDRAALLLRQAAQEAERLGARPLIDSITGLAQRARLTLNPAEGARTPAAPADPVEALGLTSRERDVLRLVAVGRSNRQIAEELFISPKTASVHVSNILAKLSVTGRGEAAALAHRLRLFPPASRG